MTTVGKPAGLAELMVSYCERAAGFCNNIGYQDNGYFDALLSMFEQALKAIARLPNSDRNALMARLDRVRHQPQLRLRCRRRYGFAAGGILRERLLSAAASGRTATLRRLAESSRSGL